MIVFVDTKSGKVDMTKEQLESILKEEYNRGYEAGKLAGTYTYTGCPYGYYTCPYHNSPNPTITWTSNTTSSSDIILNSSGGEEQWQKS